MKWSDWWDLKWNAAETDDQTEVFRWTIAGMDAVHWLERWCSMTMKTTGWRSVLSSPFPTSSVYSLIWSLERRSQLLTSVSGQQSGAASRRRRFNFSLRCSALIPQWTQLRCGCDLLALRLQTPRSVRPSPVWRICAPRSRPGRVWTRTGSCSVVTASPERRREERRREEWRAEERRGEEEDLTLISCRRRSGTLLSRPRSMLPCRDLVVQLLQCSSCSPGSKHQW